MGRCFLPGELLGCGSAGGCFFASSAGFLSLRSVCRIKGCKVWHVLIRCYMSTNVADTHLSHKRGKGFVQLMGSSVFRGCPCRGVTAISTYTSIDTKLQCMDGGMGSMPWVRFVGRACRWCEGG